MAVAHALLPLAHGGHGHSDGGADALAIIGVLAMVLPLTFLGYVAWSFWRSAKREREGIDQPPQGVSGP